MTLAQGGLEPATWKMACQFSSQLSYRVIRLAEFEYLRDPAEVDTKLACLMERVWRVQSARCRLRYKHAIPVFGQGEPIFCYGQSKGSIHGVGW